MKSNKVNEKAAHYEFLYVDDSPESKKAEGMLRKAGVRLWKSPPDRKLQV